MTGKSSVVSVTSCFDPILTITRSRIATLVAAALAVASTTFVAQGGDDPLPSWNDTAPKKAIILLVHFIHHVL